MHDNYTFLMGQTNLLVQRRQAVTATYLSVNAALTGAMAFLFKEGHLPGFVAHVAVLTLLFSGIVACGLWRRLINQHSILIDWWYRQLRTLEEHLPTDSRLITREYAELYQKKSRKQAIVGLTHYETILTWLFTTIYSIFGLAIIVAQLFKLY